MSSASALWSLVPGATKTGAGISVPIAHAAHLSSVYDWTGQVYMPAEARVRKEDGVFVQVFKVPPKPGEKKAKKKKLLEYDTCRYCGDVGRMTRDHVMPKMRLSTLAGNMVLACRTCNTAKNCRGAGQWLADLFSAARTRTAMLDALATYQRVSSWLTEGAFCDEVWQEWLRYAPTLSWWAAHASTMLPR